MHSAWRDNASGGIGTPDMIVDVGRAHELLLNHRTYFEISSKYKSLIVGCFDSGQRFELQTSTLAKGGRIGLFTSEGICLPASSARDSMSRCD